MATQTSSKGEAQGREIEIESEKLANIRLIKSTPKYFFWKFAQILQTFQKISLIILLQQW